MKIRDYGSTDSRTKTQAKKFRSAIEAAYPAVQQFSDNNPSTFLREDRYTVENDDEIGTKSRSLASVDLRREIRAMNSQILNLIKRAAREVEQAGMLRIETILGSQGFIIRYGNRVRKKQPEIYTKSQACR